MLSQFSVFSIHCVKVKWSKVQKRVRNVVEGTSLEDGNLQEIKMVFLPLISHQFKHIIKGERRLFIL